MYLRALFFYSILLFSSLIHPFPFNCTNKSSGEFYFWTIVRWFVLFFSFEFIHQIDERLLLISIFFFFIGAIIRFTHLSMIRTHVALSTFDEFNLMTATYWRMYRNIIILLTMMRLFWEFANIFCDAFQSKRHFECSTKLIKANQRYFDISSDNRIESMCQTQTNTLRCIRNYVKFNKMCYIWKQFQSLFFRLPLNILRG